MQFIKSVSWGHQRKYRFRFSPTLDLMTEFSACIFPGLVRGNVGWRGMYTLARNAARTRLSIPSDCVVSAGSTVLWHCHAARSMGPMVLFHLDDQGRIKSGLFPWISPLVHDKSDRPVVAFACPVFTFMRMTTNPRVDVMRPDFVP